MAGLVQLWFVFFNLFIVTLMILYALASTTPRELREVLRLTEPHSKGELVVHNFLNLGNLAAIAATA